MNREFRDRLRIVAPEFDNLELALVLSIRLGNALKNAVKKSTTIKASSEYVEDIVQLENKAWNLSEEIKKLYQNLVVMELTE